MEKPTKTTKRTRRTPVKTQQAPLRKKFRYLKKYVELVPDPWELGLDN